MTRFRLTLEYDGRPFMGWQAQDHGPSVQRSLEAAIERVTGERVTVHGAGRTDSGVHALGQVAHVDLDKAITPFRLSEALNFHLRQDEHVEGAIAVLDSAVAPDDFHARFSARQRAYRYRIVNRRAPLTFERGLAWHVPTALDADAMHAAAQCLIGRHDFTTFRSVQCQSDSPVKTMDRIAVERRGTTVDILVEARSFLHHQVRSITGCLKLVGDGRWSTKDMRSALEARDRSALGLNAPPDGLYFCWVRYPDDAPGL